MEHIVPEKSVPQILKSHNRNEIFFNFNLSNGDLFKLHDSDPWLLKHSNPELGYEMPEVEEAPWNMGSGQAEIHLSSQKGDLEVFTTLVLTYL